MGTYHAGLQVFQPLALQQLHRRPLGDFFLRDVQVHRVLLHQGAPSPHQMVRLGEAVGGQQRKGNCSGPTSGCTTPWLAEPSLRSPTFSCHLCQRGNIDDADVNDKKRLNNKNNMAITKKDQKRIVKNEAACVSPVWVESLTEPPEFHPRSGQTGRTQDSASPRWQTDEIPHTC